MKHTKVEIEKIVRTLLKDINRKYWEDEEIRISFEEKLKVFVENRILENGWEIVVRVDDDKFRKKEGDGIFIYINDDTEEIVGYFDCSMGRPIPLKAKLNDEGKYELTSI